MKTFTRDDGAIINVWESECKDCNFISGLATISYLSKTITISGAGCFTRRDLKATIKWAMEINFT